MLCYVLHNNARPFYFFSIFTDWGPLASKSNLYLVGMCKLIRGAQTLAYNCAYNTAKCEFIVMRLNYMHIILSNPFLFSPSFMIKKPCNSFMFQPCLTAEFMSSQSYNLLLSFSTNRTNVNFTDTNAT